jgi:hypothetical protein
MAIDHLEQLVDDLRRAHGDNLVSVILYGSHARRVALQDQPGINLRNPVSNEDILVVLDRIDPVALKRSRPIIEKWREAGHPLPLYIGRDEIGQSAEVFPAEFIDLSRGRLVLAGQDPFDGFRVPDRNLKHQLEYELESKLIRLRTLYMTVSATPASLMRLMRESLASFSGLFRHVIGLLGHQAPCEKSQSITDLADLLSLDRSVFSRILSHSEGAEPVAEDAAESLFRDYLVEIEKVIRAVHEYRLKAA